MTRSAANAASFWQPSRPQTWVFPATSALRHREVGLEVGAEGHEGELRRPGRVAGDHPEVAVLLQLEAGFRALGDATDGIEAAHARVAEPAEDQLPGHSRRHHLVVNDIRRHPGEDQVAPALANDLVTGGEGDEVREALDRDRVAVPYELGDGVVHRGDLGAQPHALRVASLAQPR